MLTLLKPEFSLVQSSLNMTPNSVPPGSGPSSPLYSFKQPASASQNLPSFQSMSYAQQQQFLLQQQQQQQLAGAKMSDFLQPQDDSQVSFLNVMEVFNLVYY